MSTKQRFTAQMAADGCYQNVAEAHEDARINGWGDNYTFDVDEQEVFSAEGGIRFAWTCTCGDSSHTHAQLLGINKALKAARKHHVDAHINGPSGL